MHKLTIIIPAFNEEEGIGETLDRLIPVAKANNFDIVVINDGSTDNTKNIVEGKDVRLINHPLNKGYGASLKTGIKAVTTEYIALYDADGQHNPEDLINLWQNIRERDMLVGMRGKDSHQDWMRKPGKWILKKTADFLTGIKIPDLNSGLRIIKRECVINRLHLFSDSFSFSTTSTVALMNLGYFVDYYPIKVNKRIGKSTVKQLKHGTSTLMLILRLVVLFNPLKVFIPVSLTLLLGGLAFGTYGYIVFERFSNSAILLTLTGLLFFFMGLISDQISTLNKR
ncbi:MAG: glycosyltransferase family 2 protein [Bacteroidales bacterium]|nr:glycosyltransferase family 2 protein [Bacteroidales bacterium]MBN2818209.1 glycosyltransferase family 2 protein [Bacteroidales bacterium]